MTFTADDEAKIRSGSIKADCFLLGDGEAEVRITGFGRFTGPRRIGAFAEKVRKRLAREEILRICFIADGGSDADSLMQKSKKLRLSRKEYMFSLGQDPDRKAVEGAELLLTNSVEEDEETILVRSGEKGVFTAKLRPFGDGMYIYGVEVEEDMRNRGYGTKYMKSIAYAFREKKLYLQVGSPNAIACRLYVHAGFEVETELCYYEL